MVSSKLFAVSALLGLMVTLPVKSAQIQVTVGGPGGVTQFSPTSVNANPGDIVSFVFQQKNHTATQSTFANPCSPAPGGFDSGFVPVSANDTGPFQEAQFEVTDTNPVWVYCRQTGHCQLGMVFAINPGNKFAAFQAAAMGNTTTTSSSSPASTTTGSSNPPSSTSQDHRVIVGGTTLTFDPANITAQPGDTITFEFHQKNHTATQSSFANPCQKLSSGSTSGQVGFDSGFMPVSANATTFPTYTVQVNDTSPIWAYCQQIGHCGDGMVFAANANESSANTFEAFQEHAKQTGTGSNSNSSSTPTTGKNGAGARDAP
ncbi:hypothetical protein BGY98DRAFT_966803 [Russula aff. rugulosa BPL654]|nr:hypothetical protein BGY98DRAFT_966803 [Russula aff. rugulosa BPL654]